MIVAIDTLVQYEVFHRAIPMWDPLMLSAALQAWSIRTFILRRPCAAISQILMAIRSRRSPIFSRSCTVLISLFLSNLSLP